MKNMTKIFLSFLVVIILAVIGFVVWASMPAGPGEVALAALESDIDIQVTDLGAWIAFIPVDPSFDTGFIFYPGGRVDYRSYAPLLREVARAGYPVYLLRVPLNLAVFSPGRAGDVIAAEAGVERWVVGGHSLGGSMAALYAAGNPGAVAGLVLWASYPTAEDDLSDSGIAAMSIYGTRDGLATSMDIEASRRLLPADTRWVPIEGGNHAQFGDYGTQTGDLPAAISPAEQWKQIVSATISLLESVEGGAE